MTYHLAKDEIAQLRAFRNKRDLFAAHVLIGDLVRTYLLMKVCEKMDSIEQWHRTRAKKAIQISIDASLQMFLLDVYHALPPQTRMAHDPHWLPSQ